MPSGKGILSKKQRDYLKGENNHNQHRKRIKDKAENLPKILSERIHKVEKDLELLKENDYLDEKTKKHFLTALTEKKEGETNLDAIMKGITIEQYSPAWILGLKVGSIIGMLIPSSIDGLNEDFLLPCYQNLFLNAPLSNMAFEDPDKISRDFRQLKDRAEEIMEQGKSAPKEMVETMGDFAEKAMEEWKDFKRDFESRGVDTEKFSGIIIDFPLRTSELLRKYGKKYDLGYEEAKNYLFDLYIEKRHILERQKIHEKLIEDIKFLREWDTTEKKRINNKLEAIDFFRVGFKDRDRNNKLDINSDLTKETNRGSPKLVGIIADKLSNREPPILKIEKLDSNKHGIVNYEYKLTNYGKCLKDFYFKGLNSLNLDRKWETFPDYWKNALENFSSSSENESKGGVRTRVRTQEEKE